MPLTTGTKLGAYEILAPLGAGGMGEVYRARDAKLNRDIAIKILPAALASDPAARARFEREAQAVAALSHPNILGIFDFGIEKDVPFAVMELLDGVTLREQLHDGAVAARKAIEYAQQIAAGLGAAHARGITHRDLKPENVFVTRDGRIKILDFGLAKIGPGADVSGPSMMATSPALTGAGTIVGTVGYMSPEQVRGRDVDHRSDVFSFGAILYELLSGQRAFTGDSAVETMNAILKEDPPELTRANAALPPALDRIVHRCLEKNPDERFHSARDVAFALDAISTTTSDTARPPLVTPGRVVRRGTAMLVAAAMLLLLGSAGGWLLGHRTEPSATDAAVTRFTVGGPDGVRISLFSRPAVSPDGRLVAFVGSEIGGRDRIWLRPLDKTTASAIAGTENATAPFWSPDGMSIAFYADGTLKKVRVAGGPVEILCDALGGDRPGGTWSRSGTILFSTDTVGLRLVSAGGGEPTVVTRLDASRGEASHASPQFLPDDRHFLYTVATSRSGPGLAFVGSVDSTDRHQLSEVRSTISYAPGGHVVFIRQGSLMTQRFDARTLQLSGEPLSITDEMRNINASFGVGGNTLVYFPAVRSTALAWFDRAGKQIRSITTAGEYGWPALSPDGHRIAIDRVDSDTGTRAIWLVDERGTNTRLTRDPTEESDVVWAPDGNHIAFGHDDGRAVYEMSLASTSSQRVLTQFDAKGSQAYPTDWSSDGRFIAYTGWGPTMTADVWLLPLATGAKPIPVAATKSQEGQARFSPDGRWIAYSSDESGRPEVYVQAMPPEQTRITISTSGGAQPMWRRDGKELFYLALDNTVMAVPLRSATSIDAGAPVALFKARIDESNFMAVRNHYAVSSDGQRFLINSVTAGANQLSVVLNWNAALGK
jgi:Tol biopolymer transport system component